MTTLTSKGRTRVVLVAALFGAIAVGFLMRSANFAQVFPNDGSVRLGVDDSWFHARRALYAFTQFPHVLQFDWYMDYPHGALAPCPPFFDWTIAAVARIFGHDTHTLEVVAAWFSPVLAALLALPAFWIGRSIAGTGAGLAAAWLVAVLPSGILTTRLGNCDTPAAVALIAGCWLASSLREVGRSGRSLAIHSVLHAAIVAAMLFTWSGSLLYLGLAEGARLASIVFLDGRPQRYFAAAASLSLAAAPVIAWRLVSLPPLGGPLTSETLSWLHAIALLSIAGLAGVLGERERRRPATGPVARGAWAVLFATVLASALLLVPAIREALLHGIDFIGKKDVWAATNPEQLPLFNSAPESLVRHATTRFGFFAYLVPLAPFIVGAHWIRARGEQRQKLLIFLIWASGLCGLVLAQVRFGADFTVPGATVFVLALMDVRSLLLRRLPRRTATAAVLALAVLLIGPGWSWDAQMLEATNAQRQLRSSGASPPLDERNILFSFAKEAGRLTPETRGFLDSRERPEYGILVPPAIGHIFTYVARRPVPANNLGPYLDLQSLIEAQNFYRTRSDVEATRLLKALGARYVVTLSHGRRPSTFAEMLHLTYDSAQESRPSTGHLRLIAQGPLLDSALALFRSRMGLYAPLELFEWVKGAVLVARADPGEQATAQIRLTTGTPLHRYVAAARADSTGAVHLRVPYPSAVGSAPALPPGAVGPAGDWTVRVGDHEAHVAVSEEDVREGREVPVRWQRQ